MAKQNPYRFSLGFDEEDPDHQEVARILISLFLFGDRKEFTMQECFACFMDMKYKNVISNTK